MNEYDTIVAECAVQGRALMQSLSNQGITEALYLYCRPSEPGKGPGRLMLVRDSAPVPPGVELVTGEGLRANVPYTSYFTWIHRRASQARVLSYWLA